MIRFTTHLTTLGEWVLQDDRIRVKLAGSGFENVYKLQTRYRPNLKLLLEVIRFYDAQQMCFIFQGKKLVPTLDDVARIMGFPVDGKPVTGLDFKRDQSRNLCRNLLGTDSFLESEKPANIIIKKLQEMKDVPIDVEGDELDKYVRAYVMHVIGCFLLPSPSERTMPVMYLKLLENVDDIKNYSWGAALLADVHHGLRNAKLIMDNTGRDPSQVALCSIFLNFFIFEYLPELVHSIYNVRVLPNAFPLMVGWSEGLHLRSLDSRLDVRNEQYRHLLNTLTIEWMPYARLASDFMPAHLSQQIECAFSCTILICFEKRVYQRPDECPRKFGKEDKDIILRRDIDSLRIIHRTYNDEVFDYGALCKSEVDDWEARRNYFVFNVSKENTPMEEDETNGNKSSARCDEVCQSFQPSAPLLLTFSSEDSQYSQPSSSTFLPRFLSGGDLDDFLMTGTSGLYTQLFASPTGLSLMKHLASCNTPVRSQSLRLLQSWLASQSHQLPAFDLNKLWKGLFYSLWHADTTSKQVLLINRFTSLFFALQAQLSLDFFRAFVLTLRREWCGIDPLRLGKLYLLIRRFVKAVFEMMRLKKWDVGVLQDYIGVLDSDGFLAEDKLQGNEVNYRVVSVFGGVEVCWFSSEGGG